MFSSALGRWLDRVAKKYPDDEIVIVSHGGVMRSSVGARHRQLGRRSRAAELRDRRDRASQRTLRRARCGIWRIAGPRNRRMIFRAYPRRQN